MEKSRVNIQQKMFSVIEEWNKSSLPIKEFCIQHQIANATFHYWLKKYRNKDQQKPDVFIPVRVKPITPGPVFAELSFPDGRKFTFYQSLDSSFVKTLLS
jgi:hypothetical protein